MMAEHLVADRGDEVEVFTSAALDALTWRDELPPGTETVNGVTVHRIASEAGRGEGFHPLVGACCWPTPPRRARRTASAGSTCRARSRPALLQRGGGQRRRRHRLLPLPLLPDHPRPAPGAGPGHPPSGGPRGAGPAPSALRCPVRAVPRLRLPHPERAAPGGRALRRRHHAAGGGRPRGRRGRRITAESTPGPRSGSATRPYLLCIGRVDDKKGTGILWRYFRSYKERHPGDLRLVLVGQIVDPPERRARHRDDRDDRRRRPSGACCAAPTPWSPPRRSSRSPSPWSRG